jgi:hypothetical protein
MIFVTRTIGRRPVSRAAPADRWSEASINGLPVAVAGPIVTARDGQFGSCYLAA